MSVIVNALRDWEDRLWAMGQALQFDLEIPETVEGLLREMSAPGPVRLLSVPVLEPADLTELACLFEDARTGFDAAARKFRLALQTQPMNVVTRENVHLPCEVRLEDPEGEHPVHHGQGATPALATLAATIDLVSAYCRREILDAQRGHRPLTTDTGHPILEIPTP